MIYIRYNNGKKLNGIVLALGDQSIRVAVQGSDDAVAYRLISGVWVSEDCEVVTFEFAEGEFPAEDERQLPRTIFPSEAGAPVLHRIM